MMENAKRWLWLAGLLGIGIALSVSAAFLCAGLIILVLKHPEAAVFCAFATWVLRFAWSTREDAGLDGGR